MNIVYKSDTGFVIELHCTLAEDDKNLGVVEIGAVSVPYRNINLGKDSVIIHIPFKDLTIYDLPSYEERRASLMDMEQNDGKDRRDS